VIPVYDEAGKAIETHEHAGEFKVTLKSQKIAPVSLVRNVVL